MYEDDSEVSEQEVEEVIESFSNEVRHKMMELFANNPLGLRQRIKVLLENNKKYKERFGLERDH